MRHLTAFQSINQSPTSTSGCVGVAANTIMSTLLRTVLDHMEIFVYRYVRNAANI